MVVFLFLFGFGLSIIGSTYLISYMNLLTLGYNLEEYVNFIVRRYECWYFLIGFALIFISLYIGGKKNELYI